MEKVSWSPYIHPKMKKNIYIFFDIINVALLDMVSWSPTSVVLPNSNDDVEELVGKLHLASSFVKSCTFQFDLTMHRSKADQFHWKRERNVTRHTMSSTGNPDSYSYYRCICSQRGKHSVVKLSDVHVCSRSAILLYKQRNQHAVQTSH